MFYDVYERLCNQAGKKPYTVSRELGCGPSNVAQWKKGSTPRPELLQQMVLYFGTTIEYLTSGLRFVDEWRQSVREDWDGLSSDEDRKLMLKSYGVPPELETAARELFEGKKNKPAPDTGNERLNKFYSLSPEQQDLILATIDQLAGPQS